MTVIAELIIKMDFDFDFDLPFFSVTQMGHIWKMTSTWTFAGDSSQMMKCVPAL